MFICDVIFILICCLGCSVGVNRDRNLVILNENEGLGIRSSTISLLDEGDYFFTNAVTNNEGNTDISDSVNVKLFIITSHTYLAGTSDTISALFVGDFSSSGPHVVGSYFEEGKKVNVTIPLSREIGNLKEIIFYNAGTNGWLPADVTCQIKNQLYILSSPQQWVVSLDPDLFASTGIGYSNDQYMLPSGHGHLVVKDAIQMYTLNGEPQLV